MNPILEVQQVSKAYGKRVAVDSVSFEVFPGEVFGFLGPNGAGKSTTIKMITGLTSMTTGEIFICGYNVKTHFEKAAKHFGAIIENPCLFLYLSGIQNLKYFAMLHGNVSDSKIMDVIRLVGLEKRINDKVSKYSLGMKQRLGIAQALLHSPALLILDEPTNGLDANGIKEIRGFLRELAKSGIAIMVSSHILAEMEQLCDRIGIISDGKLVEIKTIDEIKRNMAADGRMYIKVSHPNLAGKILIEEYRTEVKVKGKTLFFELDEDRLSNAIKLFAKKGISVYGAGKMDSTLEELFLKATNHSGTEIK